MSYSQIEMRERVAAYLNANRHAMRQLVEEGFHEPPLAITASTTLTAKDHGGKLVAINKADGAAITLPEAGGTGVTFRLFIGTTITSNSTTVKVANANDTLVGMVEAATTTFNSGRKEAAGGTDDTLTMNGTTTGGIVGSYVELQDVAENLWRIKADLVGSGTLATSLSATVS